MCLKKLSDFLVWKQYFIQKNKIQNLEGNCGNNYSSNPL